MTNESTDVHGIFARMPTFFKNNIKMFFAQLKATFTINKIEDEVSKYNYLKW